MATLLPSLLDLDVHEKRVFLRADLNVPLHENGMVLDDTRIRAVLPTLRHLIRNNARIILASHLGRPEGKVDPALSMASVGMKLAELLYPMASEIKLSDEIVGDGTKTLVREMLPGEIVLLENLRFDPREENNDDRFARSLADSMDIYVNEAFACSHRAHASLSAIVKYIPSKAAGFLLAQEVDFLRTLLDPKERPYVVVLGGKKIADKIRLLDHLMSRVHALVIGGALAHPFLQAQGFSVGQSNVPADQVSQAQKILAAAQKMGVPIWLPKDAVAAKDMDATKAEIVPISHFPNQYMALDIGPETRDLFIKKIEGARTVFWNGPMGAYEKNLFSDGTTAIAKAVSLCQGISVVGGGDTLSALHALHIRGPFSHLSTGGGATLEFLEGRALPGLVALTGL